MLIKTIFVNLLAVICQMSLKVCYCAVTPPVLLTSRFLMMFALNSLSVSRMERKSSYFPKLRQKRPVVPGWNDSARPLCKSAKFWHRIWLECGCPISGVLFQIKKKAKKRYKYEVRRLRRQEDHIRNELMGQALSQSRTRDFWKKVRRLTKSSS